MVFNSAFDEDNNDKLVELVSDMLYKQDINSKKMDDMQAELRKLRRDINEIHNYLKIAVPLEDMDTQFDT